MNSRQRQAVLLVGIMFLLVVFAVFVLADTSGNREGNKLIKGPILPEPINDIVNQSIYGLTQAQKDASNGTEAIDGTG